MGDRLNKRDYGENWEEQRVAARTRAGFRCERCGRSELELRRELDVHHRVRFIKFESYEEANKLDNLIALCKSCHKIEERGNQLPSGGIVQLKPLTIEDYLGGGRDAEEDLLTLVRNTAQSMGLKIDAMNVQVSMLTSGEYLTIPFVTRNPLTAFFVNGYQRDIHPDEQVENIWYDIELQERGWRVVRLNWLDLLVDPVSGMTRAVYE